MVPNLMLSKVFRYKVSTLQNLMAGASVGATVVQILLAAFGPLNVPLGIMDWAP